MSPARQGRRVPVAVADRVGADKSRADLRDGLRLGVAHSLRPRAIGHCDVESEHTLAAVGRRLIGEQRSEARLAVCGKRCLKAQVHPVQNRRDRAEVAADAENIVRMRGFQRCASTQICLHVGAAESVDRLLGIADHEERAVA